MRPNTFNYNTQTTFVQEKLRESIREFGFVDPIDVRSGDEDGAFTENGEPYYEIIGGEHRWIAAKAEGLTEVRINDLGLMDDDTAKKLCIVLNETKGKPDEERLAGIISDLNSRSVDLSVLPYDQSTLDAYCSMHGDIDWEEFNKGGKGEVGDEDEEDEEEDEPEVNDVYSLLDFDSMDEDDESEFIEMYQEFMESAGVSQNKPWRGIEVAVRFYMESMDDDRKAVRPVRRDGRDKKTNRSRRRGR